MVQRQALGGPGESEILGVREVAQVADDLALDAPDVMRRADMHGACRLGPLVLDPHRVARREHHPASSAAASSASVKTPARSMLPAMACIQRR